MVFTEIKERGDKKYYYRVKSIRKGEKVEKKRVYLGANLNKQELLKKEKQADKEMLVTKKEKKSKTTTFGLDKEKQFSEWFTEIIQKAELADIRYNVKGFIVFQPWSVFSMEKMYSFLEKTLQNKDSNKR